MATYNEVPDVTTGDTWTADNQDLYLRGNFQAVFDGLTANQLVRLNAAGNALEAAGGLIAARQGGSATDWNTDGTTDYTPSAPKIQCGVKSISISSSTSGTSTITFPSAFTNKPLVFTSVAGFSGNLVHLVRSWAVTNSGCNLTAYLDGSGSASVEVAWLAIGE